jgi:hypothetical protein
MAPALTSTPASAPPSASAAAPASAPASAPATAPYPAAAASSAAAARTAVTPAAPPAPAAPAVDPSDPKNFGFTQAQLHAAPAGPSKIQARIVRLIGDPTGRDYMELDNGQTWTFTEANEDARLGPGETVSIKRAALGSFMMTTASRHTFHVRRIH